MNYTFKNNNFWKSIPGWQKITEEEFTDHLWQMKNSVTKIDQVKKLLGEKLSEEFLADLEAGQKRTPMNIRITPYIFSLIDWNNPVDDPLRKQFLPIGSQFLEDHPYYRDDSLNEDGDSPVPMITHRYPDKVLFLPITHCPVYCSYCTRSRIVGGSTESKDKSTYGAKPKEWEIAFQYLRDNPQIEDVVISGGDAYMLRPNQIYDIGKALLDIPNIRRIRYATKGIAIFPQKIITDKNWVQAIQKVYEYGRSLKKEVCIHTHFSSPKEITSFTVKAMDVLYQVGITVRNQAVLQTGVNDDFKTMQELLKKISYLNIQPYYVYQHDMVPGCEHFRTTLREAIELSKEVKGITAGFNTPTFVCDLLGGGGKREISSFEYYDEEKGISLWKAPKVKPNEVFFYFDPIHKLSKKGQKFWTQEKNKIEKYLLELKKKIN